MRKFFKNLLGFFVFFIIVAELIIRIFHLSTDAPRTYKNANGNINYYPDQQGYWDGGRHKWYINEMGYPGKNLPASYDNLILLVGDSYIQNFMNPDSCRQKSYLDKLRPEYDYLEVSMAGLNLLGYLEYSKPLDSLNPMLKLIYINSKDFVSNIKLKDNQEGYLVDIESGKLTFPKFKGSRIKEFIYNFKFTYYLYRKNIDFFQGKKFKKKNSLHTRRSQNLNYENIRKVLYFINTNYEMSNIILVFHPNSDPRLIDLCKESGIRSIELQKNEKDNWSTREDGHWSCYGHGEVAKQVSRILRNNLTMDNNHSE